MNNFFPSFFQTKTNTIINLLIGSTVFQVISTIFWTIVIFIPVGLIDQFRRNSLTSLVMTVDINYDWTSNFSAQITYGFFTGFAIIFTIITFFYNLIIIFKIIGLRNLYFQKNDNQAKIFKKIEKLLAVSLIGLFLPIATFVSLNLATKIYKNC